MKKKKDLLKVLSVFLFLFIILIACGNIGKPRVGKHKVELVKVCIDADDFHKSTFGNPLNIKVKLLKDGSEVGSTILSGKRGERYVSEDNSWTIEYSTRSNYQVVVEEMAIIATSWKYSIPGTPKIGYWPFSGRITIGSGSYIEFSDTALE